MTDAKMRAYLACALTGLGDGERSEIFSHSDVIAKVCSEYGISLYQPREFTDPVAHADREARDVYLTDRERVATSDLVIALCTIPSYGVGAENEIAAAAGTPVLYLVKSGFRLSKMLTGSPGDTQVAEFGNLAELESTVRSRLAQLIPRLKENRERNADHDGNLLPTRLRDLRERSGETLESLSIETGIPKDRLALIESKSERISAPTATEIRKLAETFGVPAGYFMGEPIPGNDPTEYKSLLELKSYARNANLKYPVYERLWEDYMADRRQIGFSAETRDASHLTEQDWKKRHDELLKKGANLTLNLVP